MRNFETYKSESALMKRIDQLKAAGVKDSDIRVITQNKQANDSLNYVNIKDVNDAEPSIGDKIMAFFTGDTPTEHMLASYDFDDNVQRQALASLRNGYYLLGTKKDYNYALKEDDARFMEMDDDIKTRSDIDYNEKIRLHEERLRIDKENVQTGEVRVHTDVVSNKQAVDVDLNKERVVIERRKVDNPAKVGDKAFIKENGDVVVPVHEEKLNVDKDVVATEEVVIKKEHYTDKEHVEADLKKEVVDVEGDVTKNGKLKK